MENQIKSVFLNKKIDNLQIPCYSFSQCKQQKGVEYALKVLSLSLSLIVIFGSLLIGCAFPFGSGTGNAQISDISDALTYRSISRQAFMGGSVLYNPKQESSGQLAPGVVIATRMGKTIRTIIDDVQATFSDSMEDARYGYITIDNIDETFVSFSYIEYTGEGSSSTERFFCLSLSESVDINGDGIVDIQYAKPVRKRPGFEKAVYLNFLSSKQDLNTSMFAVLPEQYSRGAYPSGIFGVNNDGRFIVTKYDTDGMSRAAVKGLVYGDYVLDSKAGRYERFVGRSNYRYARSVDEPDLTFSEINQISLYYVNEEFDEFYTPQSLYSVLPSSITSEYTIAGFSDTEIIIVLNKILERSDLLDAIIADKDLTLSPENQSNLAKAKALPTDQIIMVTRRFVDEIYPEQSPSVALRTTSLNAVLPLASVLVGGDQNYTSQRINSERSSRAAIQAVSLNDYDVKWKELHKKFTDKYRVLSTIPITLSPNTELSVTLTNTNIQLGFTGFFNISWSNLSYNIDGAVFATLSTNIAASMNYNKNLLTKNLIPEVPQVPIGPLLITLKPTLDFSLPLHIEVPGKITSKMCVEVAGLFTAGVTASFNYGIEWVNVFWFVCLPRPYFSSTGNTWSTYDTIAFVGSESGNTIALNGIKVSLTPTISFGLKAGLLNFLYGKCSINVGLENAIQIAYKQPEPPRVHRRLFYVSPAATGRLCRSV